MIRIADHLQSTLQFAVNRGSRVYVQYLTYLKEALKRIFLRLVEIGQISNTLFLSGRALHPRSVVFFFLVALRPNAGHGLLILEVYRSFTTMHHSR